MPELAEVEFNRKQWDAGLRQKVLRVVLHPGKRIFRGTNLEAMERGLRGAIYLGSAAHGKQMLFRFSGGAWLGLHLGMTGRLRAGLSGDKPSKHDHLVLVQCRAALAFADPRQFGRVRFHRGNEAPAWWRRLPPAVTSAEFTVQRMGLFLRRHGRLAIKAALLSQEGFPGLGNWMADEILWRGGLDPRAPAGAIEGERLRRLWRTVRWVSRRALAIIGGDDSDLPRGWLFHQRWSSDGVCPLHKHPLRRAVVGGRTTAWCATCQKQ